MDTQQFSSKHSFSGSSLTLPAPQQEPRAFHSSSPFGNNSRPVHTGQSDTSTVVDNRSIRQNSCLVWSLPQKRSNQNPSLGRVGDPEETDTRAFSGVFLTKRLKRPVTPSLSSSVASCNYVPASGLSRQLRNISEAMTQSLERIDSAEATDDLLGSNHPKCLQSPFEYTQDPVTKGIDHNEPVYGKNSSGYFYFAPTNPSDKTFQALDAPPHKIPRRRLSYVDPPSKPRPRSLHKSIGSRELRHEAKRHAEDCNIQPRSDGTLIARPYLSEPIRSKSRLWLDSSEQKDELREAVSISKFHETRTY